MIRDLIWGDITSPSNKSDIIIGMNTELSDVQGIGLRFVKDSIPTRTLQLGSVITFNFDAQRRLHMIICHNLGKGGWEGAERHVRFGLDYLEHIHHLRTDKPDAEYSIVKIGTGRVGKRDGADHMKIFTGIADSNLIVDLYQFDPAETVASADVIELRPLRAWSPVGGEERLAA